MIIVLLYSSAQTYMTCRYVLRTSSARGGGGRCQTFYFLFFSLFSRPRAGLATGPCKVVFFGLATNALNVRNNNNNNLQLPMNYMGGLELQRAYYTVFLD